MPAAIRVESLGKTYRVGRQQRAPYRTLRESLGESAAAAWRRLSGGPRGDRAEEFRALDGVSFEVEAGEVVGVIGRNGAGKSTLLKILSRVTPPTVGAVDLLGRVGSLLEVGTGFHPELTGRENVYLNGSILGMSRAEINRRFDEIVDFAEVGRFLDTPVKRYSSGMYVRLAFAVAAHLEPEILLVDEVLAVGDAVFQKKCLGKIRDVARGGRTVVLVSHNLGAVMSLCDRALWIDGGKVRAYGDVREVGGDYLEDGTTAAAGRVDLRDSPRDRGRGEHLRLTSIEWLTGVPLRHGEPLSVLIGFEARRDAEGVSIGLGFSSIDGQRLLTYDSDFGGPRQSVAAGREERVELRVDHLPLVPGRYRLDLGARSADLHALDYLQGSDHIEVVPGAETPGFVTSFPGAGVRLEASWSWSCLETLEIGAPR